jgi:ATP-dependent exoDNAse (exonuclease V) alpha subunit
VQRTAAGWSPVGEEFVWNGSTGTIRDVNPRGENEKNTVMLVIELDETPVATGGNAHVLVKADVRQFGAPSKMRADQHARDAHLWDYGYALTAHKGQGSEYDRVVVLDQNPAERKRWMYTAMTRAKEKLVVISWR